MPNASTSIRRPIPTCAAGRKTAPVGGTVDYRWETAVGKAKLAFRTGVDGVGNRVFVRIFTEAPTDTALTTSVEESELGSSGFAIGDFTSPGSPSRQAPGMTISGSPSTICWSRRRIPPAATNG